MIESKVKIMSTTRCCGICGKDYETLIVDGHVTYPNICAACMRSIAKTHHCPQFEIDKGEETK